MMKKLFIFSMLLIISGCQALQKVSPPPQTAQASTGCPEKPKAALTKPEEIQLNSQSLVKSGQASADKSVGYTFTAQAGQKLSYRTNDDICIWIYAPDTQLLSSGELPQTGKYALQVSAPKGSTTFNLEMSLGTLEASQFAVASSKEEASTSKTSTSETPSPTIEDSTTSADNSTSTSTSETPSPTIEDSTTSTDNSTNTSTSETPASNFSTTEAADLSQDEAIELVQNWYKAKPYIFGPSFDRSLVEKYATGKLYQDKLKPGGSIDWLSSHNSYYTYKFSTINKVISFFYSGSRPAIIVNVSEELYLHGPKAIDRENSGLYTSDFIYLFEKDNGVWKIYDYKKITR